MSKRKAITERMKIDAMLYRFDIACDWCGAMFLAGDALRWDHWTPLGLGGEHNFTNLQPLHVKCHDEKTRGRGATTAGSDIGKISKERRIIRTCKFAVKKGRKRVTKFPKGRKLQSRPFQKRKVA